jgi:cell division protein ZapE
MMYDQVSQAAYKRRDHFHQFLLEVHARLHEQRGVAHNAADKLGNVARDIAAEVRLCVLDEFQVVDISEAVIVHQLFRKLFEHGVVLVTTSNRAPESLYENGIQRDLFLPLIPILRERCVVHEMALTVDYRLRHSHEVSSTYFLDADGGARRLEDKFVELAGGFPVVPDRLALLGRTLSVSTAVPRKRLAKFSFEELFERPLSSADYLTLCAAYHTILIHHVPVLDVIMDRNAVRRLTNFVDCAYESRVKLVVHAAAEPAKLLHGIAGSDGRPVTEEAFAAGRTVSRLIEMQSDAYLGTAWMPSGHH